MENSLYRYLNPPCEKGGLRNASHFLTGCLLSLLAGTTSPPLSLGARQRRAWQSLKNEIASLSLAMTELVHCLCSYHLWEIPFSKISHQS